jgi:hypothetical protein
MTKQGRRLSGIRTLAYARLVRNRRRAVALKMKLVIDAWVDRAPMFSRPIVRPLPYEWPARMTKVQRFFNDGAGRFVAGSRF